MSISLEQKDKIWVGAETVNPRVFVDSFLKSESFVNGRHDDIKGGKDLRGYKEFKENVESKVDSMDRPTNKEIELIYFDLLDSRLLMADFARDDLMLVYSPDNYSDVVNGLYGEYKAIVRETRKFLDQDSRIQLDESRSVLHNDLAKRLLHEEIVPSVQLGRAMARLWLISEGLDSFNAFENDELRRSSR